MSLRKPGSNQRYIMKQMLSGERLVFDPDDKFLLTRMEKGNWAIAIDRRIPESLLRGGYIGRISDTLGRRGWAVTEAGKEALEK